MASLNTVKRRIFLCILAGFCFSCATYYQVNLKFNRFFEEGELEKAEKTLSSNQKAGTGKAKLLYYMNLGVVAALQGHFEESNLSLEQAYLLGEDLRNNYWNTATALLLNPNVTYYTGEDHELLMIHYYKALNFLQLGDPQSALVECRRLNIKLQKLSDHYQTGLLGHPGKYTRDAFIHTLMGLIYEADKDINNAFIAYRNAVDIYRTDYLPLFGIDAPEQLKQDLLRTAYIMGFTTELKRYEELLGITYQPEKQAGGELVFFWNNGLCPIKAEWGLHFALVRGAGGLVNFQNDAYGLNFPFYLDSDKDYEEKGLHHLEFIRIAFPKYVERHTVFNSAELETIQGKCTLEKAEDINAIAFRSLQQRMWKECSVSLLRIAVKKAAEYGIRQENEDLGALVGMVNALTEKADTRNWQTIPHSIYYGRVPLPEGEQKVRFILKGSQGEAEEQVHELTFHIQPQKTTFFSFHSLEAKPFSPYPIH